MIEDIKEVFDQNFYNDFYGCKSNVDEFIRDCLYDGRFVHPCIIEDDFDYASFVGNLSWENIKIDNQYQAIKYYLDNRDKYQKIFKDKLIVSSESSSYNTCALYVVESKRSLSENIVIDSIETIQKYINDIYIVIIGDRQFSKTIVSKYSNKIIDVSNAWTIKNLVKKYDHCIYVNNKLYINDNIKNLLQKNYHSDILSISDKYEFIDGKYYRCLNTDLLLINTRHLLSLLRQLIKYYNDNTNYQITKFCRLEKLSYNYYIEQRKEKEIFWNDLYTQDILNYTAFVHKHNMPAITSNTYDILQNNTKGLKISADDLTKPGFSVVHNINTITKKYYPQDSIACHIHIGTNSDRCIQDIDNIIQALKPYNITYFLTSNQPIDQFETFVLPNKGADIGPFLYTLYHKILPNNYKFILKLHTKSHHGFRRMCYDSIATNFSYILYMLKNNTHKYIAGPLQKNMMLDNINQSIIDKFCSENFIYTNNSLIDFFAGTMFLCKAAMFTEFIQKYNINLLSEYMSLEMGYKKNHTATRVHSWERILSGIIPFSLQSSKIYI